MSKLLYKIAGRIERTKSPKIKAYRSRYSYQTREQVADYFEYMLKEFRKGRVNSLELVVEKQQR